MFDDLPEEETFDGLGLFRAFLRDSGLAPPTFQEAARAERDQHRKAQLNRLDELLGASPRAFIEEALGRSNAFEAQMLGVVDPGDFLRQSVEAFVVASNETMMGYRMERVLRALARPHGGRWERDEETRDGVDIEVTRGGVVYLVSVKSSLKGHNDGSAIGERLKFARWREKHGPGRSVLGIVRGSIPWRAGRVHDHEVAGVPFFDWLAGDEPGRGLEFLAELHGILTEGAADFAEGLRAKQAELQLRVTREVLPVFERALCRRTVAGKFEIDWTRVDSFLELSLTG